MLLPISNSRVAINMQLYDQRYGLIIYRVIILLRLLFYSLSLSSPYNGRSQVSHEGLSATGQSDIDSLPDAMTRPLPKP